MMPDNVLSSQAIVAGSVDPVKSPGDFLVDWERGGIGLNDPSQGLLVQVWKLEVERDDVDIARWNFFLSAPSFPKTQVYYANDVVEASLAFDQNMHPFISFVAAGVTKIWWYDTTLPGQTTTALGTDFRSPRCLVDEKRPWHTDISDINLWYVRGSNLCVRYQRDRFLVEYVMKSIGPEAELVSVAMSTAQRLQIRVRKSNVSITDDQVKVSQYPYLSDVVQDLCRRAGISPENVDVNDLYGDTVVGYPVMSDEDASELIEPLGDAFVFDPSESDKKLRFLKRGRNAVMRVTYKDLVNRDDGSFRQTIVQEDKLPIRVEVNHLDPAGGFNKNMQAAFRKSNLVKAKGVESIDLPFSVTADQAATIALKNIKMKWHEPVTYEFWLTVAFTELVPTDVIEYADEEGNVYRIRIEERNEDSGYLKFKGKKDGGSAVYATEALGLNLPTPISTTPGLVGETRLEILNLPALRDQDDELGVYVAVAGSSSAWYGADILISTDGGVNYYDAFSTEQPATLGDTETELLAEVSSEYLSRQTVIVKVNFGLDSIDYAGLLNNYNRCVIGDEILQFQTATHLGDNRYLLSGLVRGRYNTKPEPWAAGTRFVLLDSTVAFLQAQQWMLGQEIYLKPVSFGLTEDESVPTAYDLDVAYSQLEWPPHHVRADRDGSDMVVVNWIPRPRLGIETAPHQSKYFTGYKVKFSDGHTAIVTAPTYTRASTPASVTITVCGVNSITGDGEDSEGVTV